MSVRSVRSRALGRRLPRRSAVGPVGAGREAIASQPGPLGPLWVVVPCKGRLAFLQRTAHRVLGEAGLNYCLVDYSCPDLAGNWFEREFAEAVRQGRAVVERVPGQALFDKCRAHNAGARRAIREGAEYLCFLDADTIVHPGFGDFVLRHRAPHRFLISGLRADGTDMASMTGLLVVHAKAFEDVGGFDERFRGWGGEDIELRLRLFLLRGLNSGDVPLSFVRPIPHDNALRTRFYDQSNIRASNRDNMQYIRTKIAGEWAGRCIRPVSAAGRLWYRPGFSTLEGPRDIEQPRMAATVDAGRLASQRSVARRALVKSSRVRSR